MLCKKCFNETCIAYALKTKCLDTERTLRNLERKFQSKLKEKVQEILQNDIKDEMYQVVTEEIALEYVEDKDEQFDEQQQFLQVFEDEDENEFAAPPSEMYEEIEYLEAETIDDQLKIEAVEIKPDIKNQKLYCIYCKPNVAFKTEIGLNSHKWDVHQLGEANPLVCPTCSYTFSSEAYREEELARLMQRHHAAHQIGRMNSCTLCPEVFKSVRNLEDHLYRHHHHSQSQNRCKGCQSDFPTYMDLRAHLATTACKDINNERAFKCFICKETFVMGIAKKKHVQTVHKDKAGADCPLCLRCKIPSAVAYENHYKTHFAGKIRELEVPWRAN